MPVDEKKSLVWALREVQSARERGKKPSMGTERGSECPWTRKKPSMGTERGTECPWTRKKPGKEGH